ncbi:MAG: hypothetical protein FJ271_10360 [Planctomycetes bacterium]|nr:hypothetical protein [Planctomycetota bacterium]
MIRYTSSVLCAAILLGNARADIVRLTDLEKEAEKALPPVAVFYRTILKSAARPDASVPAARQGLDLVEALLKDKKVSSSVALPAAERALLALAWIVRMNAPDDGDLQRRLDDKLLDIRQRRLGVLAEEAKHANAWQEALAFADSLLDQYPRSLAVGKQVRRLWADVALSEADPHKARQLWLRAQQRFLDSPEMRPVQEMLQKQARQWLDETAKLDNGPALEKLSQAFKLWPRLSGLRDARRRREKRYVVVQVGVRQLPEFLSPATAVNDAEKLALDLIYEGLVQPTHSNETLQTHEARLAARLPESRPLHRRFTLRRDAYWSSGERVIPADVRHSIQLATDAKVPGRTSSWLDVFDVPEVDGASFTLDFRMKQGLFDPLALLSFKVLPQSFRDKPLNRGDDLEFARSPVGSGPFIYQGRREIDGRSCAVFSANPSHVRGDRPDEPRIDEIRMFAWKDAKDLAATERGALLLDVPMTDLAAVAKLGTHQVRTLRPRRVHFLAVNHRVATLADDSLRRGLAHAIDREGLLRRHFRGRYMDVNLLAPLGAALALPLVSLPPRHADLHRALSGPYPPDSWASPPGVRDLLDANLARSLFRQMPKDRTIKLSLKHADDDPRLGPALRDLARQVESAAAEGGVNLRIAMLAMPARALKSAIDRRDFELAYCHWDYESVNYWLWPLFDPQAAAVQPGGSNYLGYDNDAILQNLFRAALGHRQFTALQSATHDIHARLTLKMPLIPLWQLDVHAAVPTGITTGVIDPLRVFADVGRWQRKP